MVVLSTAGLVFADFTSPGQSSDIFSKAMRKVVRFLSSVQLLSDSRDHAWANRFCSAESNVQVT